MSLELVNTLGTLLTVAIIAATAIAAMVQLRHLRAGNQINAMLSIANQFDAKEFREAQQLLAHRHVSAVEDPLYREYALARARNLPLPSVPDEYVQLRSAVLLIGNTYEELGILVKNGIVEKHLFLDRYFGVIAQAWNRLQRDLAYTRDVVGTNAVWENFELLAVLSQDWSREHPSSYPKGVRRLELHNPWPVTPMPATA